MKKLLFIYNAAAGKGRLKQQLATVQNRLVQAGWLVTVYPTQGKGDAERAARELGSRFDRVVCAGGDGTLSETVSGLVDLPQPPTLGYIPAGSTNDCARNLRLPTDMGKSAMIAAADGVSRALDVGKLNDRAFIYVAAFGAFTEVAYDTPQDLKNTFGHLAYVMAGIGHLVNLSPYRLKVEYNDTVIEDDFLYGMVCNDVENEDGILVRSAQMHDYIFPEHLRAIARAGAGTNNIPIDRCSEAGIVVFNTPGANANAVKELVLTGLLISSRDILGGRRLGTEAGPHPRRGSGRRGGEGQVRLCRPGAVPQVAGHHRSGRHRCAGGQ